ncbi:MAG: InlB B-repeat-containing protein, partial [Clostridia bacterium]|nr:InlB B-repeat-containing protein [Clostridia bacterium]
MTRTKKLFAALIAVLMIMAVLPVAALASEAAYEANEAKQMKRWDDVWAMLNPVEDEMLAKGATRAETTYAVYKAALNCPLIDEGSIVDLDDNEFSFTTNGMWGGYNYRVRNYTKAPAKMTAKAASGEDVARTVEKINNTKGTCGAAGAVNVLLVQPYSGYDSSFTQQYNTEAASIASALGGTVTELKGNNATGPAIASAYTGKGVVIYDSHGNCIDANQTSYLDLHTSTGLTSSDYSNGWAYNGSSFYGIDGRYIKNHVSGTLSCPIVWMAICEGMKKAGKGTTGTALLEAGAGCVYGYSQSVSFTGDYTYEATFWTQMKNGKTVAEAISTMKSTHGNWDPAYSSSSGAAWPIVMSALDSFPSNPDGTQTVKCDWTLFGSSYTVTATSNNTSWGTVSVSGTTITASPKTGYYAAGYTVTSGTATVVQNGNTFTVTPSSDCTVRINFAAKTQYTVNFVASGTAQGSQTAYSGDAITLPSSVNVNPDGWTFKGWVANQIAETSTKPTFYNAGASYTVTGNTTLYALYTRLDSAGGDTIYQLADTLEVGGKYAITIGNYAVSNTVYNTSLNHYVTSQSVTINDTTNTLTVASSVDVNTILYEIESGS